MPEPLDDLQRGLVEHLKADGSLTDPGVEAAFRAVPRHLFLPGVEPADVYSDIAIPTKFENGRAISSSSQPAIMAIMLEQLAPRSGQRLLEIGAGTGYNAALLGHLVGPGGQVTSIDIDDDIVAGARDHLQAAGSANVQVICADGGLGYAPGAPYDGIILTVSAWDIAPAWIEQLAVGGRLVLPLTLGHSGPQKAVALRKLANPLPSAPWLESLSIRDCGFMPLRGAFAGPERIIPLGPEPGLHLALGHECPVPPEAIYAWLLAGGQDQPLAVRLTREEIWQGLSLWLSLHAAGQCTLVAEGPAADKELVPCLFDMSCPQRMCITNGIIDAGGLAVLAPPAEDPAPEPDASANESPPALAIRSYGPESQVAHHVAAHLAGHIAAWDAAGRRVTAGMRLRAFPRAADYAPAEGEVVIPKQWMKWVVTWGDA